MPEPNPNLNGQIYYVPGQPEIYWIDNGLARHIPDEATYHGVFGGSPNKQAYSALLTQVTVGLPIADGTELVRAGNDAEIYFVEQQTKRWIPNETIKAKFQLNGNVHSLPLATVNSFANGPAFVDPDPPPTPPVAPSGLHVISKQAAAGPGASSITIGWTDNSDNEAGFNITYDGSLPGSPDDKGKTTVSSNSTTATISGLTSGYTYVIEVQSFNAAGNGGTTYISSVGIPYVAPRVITVSKQGTGSAASAIVSGSGFTPNSLIVVKIVAANLLSPVQFSTTAGGDGKFSSSKSFSCVSGIAITFTAFEDAKPTATISNAVSMTC